MLGGFYYYCVFITLRRSVWLTVCCSRTVLRGAWGKGLWGLVLVTWEIWCWLMFLCVPSVFHTLFYPTRKPDAQFLIPTQKWSKFFSLLSFLNSQRSLLVILRINFPSLPQLRLWILRDLCWFSLIFNNYLTAWLFNLRPSAAHTQMFFPNWGSFLHNTCINIFYYLYSHISLVILTDVSFSACTQISVSFSCLFFHLIITTYEFFCSHFSTWILNPCVALFCQSDNFLYSYSWSLAEYFGRLVGFSKKFPLAYFYLGRHFCHSHLIIG